MLFFRLPFEEAALLAGEHRGRSGWPDERDEIFDLIAGRQIRGFFRGSGFGLLRTLVQPGLVLLRRPVERIRIPAQPQNLVQRQRRISLSAERVERAEAERDGESGKAELPVGARLIAGQQRVGGIPRGCGVAAHG